MPHPCSDVGQSKRLENLVVLPMYSNVCLQKCRCLTCKWRMFVARIRFRWYLLAWIIHKESFILMNFSSFVCKCSVIFSNVFAFSNYLLNNFCKEYLLGSSFLSSQHERFLLPHWESIILRIKFLVWILMNSKFTPHEYSLSIIIAYK